MYSGMRHTVACNKGHLHLPFPPCPTPPQEGTNKRTATLDVWDVAPPQGMCGAARVRAAAQAL
jgi:hypothetical protein